MALTNPGPDFPCNPGTSMPACRDRSEPSPLKVLIVGGQSICLLQALAFVVCLES